ncbi:helix-turn-helix domain-containing protein [Nocardia brasiliensis]|uniref:helix-turn-helix domain-containing protein n=1 Tax=Nocardia brasiliensis TaxID=37326 RepID=UPI002456EC11|nr:helix-turn-helix transcriptional regulator [Nocardia brasiliensis]
MSIDVAVDPRPDDSVEVPRPGFGEVLTPKQAAAAIFSRRLSALISESVVSTDDGATRSLTLYSLARHLELAYPDVAVSQSGLYRLIHGDAIPRLDLIIALGRVFDVPVEYFVTEQKSEHEHPRP